MILIIVAAGRGSRLQDKTKYVPKCMVNINNKSIIDYNLDFINKFKKTVIITGYKSKILEDKFKKNKKIKIIKNPNYLNTNMVYSFFCAYKFLKKEKKDVMMCYSDIIFDKNLFNISTEQSSFIFAKKDWLKLWKKRMKISNIKRDAEDFVTKKNKLISIGGKINKKFPKLQFMGLIKIKFSDLKKLFIFFKNIKNKKIDFTTFINQALKNRIIDLNVIKTNKFWYEIDSKKDLEVAKKFLS